MLQKTIALAALLLAGGFGAALGQPTVSSSDPNLQNPTVNPSAAGTRTGRSASGTSTLKKADEHGGSHGGSKEVNANSHPLTALKARKQQQKQSQYTRRPQQTMDAAAGR